MTQPPPCGRQWQELARIYVRCQAHCSNRKHSHGVGETLGSPAMKSHFHMSCTRTCKRSLCTTVTTGPGCFCDWTRSNLAALILCSQLLRALFGQSQSEAPHVFFVRDRIWAFKDSKGLALWWRITTFCCDYLDLTLCGPACRLEYTMSCRCSA